MDKTGPTSRVIDVHSHLYTESYLHLLESRDEIPYIVSHGGTREFIIFTEEQGPDGVGGRMLGPEYTSLGTKLAFMDQFGIDQSVVSMGNPWLDPFPDQQGDEACKVINQELAGLEDESDGRVVAMGVLPVSSVEAALNELHSIKRMQGLVGVVTGPQIAGLPFDNQKLNPFWNELSKLALPLFVHPKDGVANELLVGYRHTLPVGVGFPVETTIALTRLVFGGVLERFPRLKILVAHGGGTLPYLAGRLDAAWKSDTEVEALLLQAPSTYLKALYLDALVYYGPALQAACGLVGSSQLLFGTDNPFTVSDPKVNLETIENEMENDEDKALIKGGVANNLFSLS
ncbi:MAG: amidohydrolase [Chloroflexi bacterium]|nr:MAG: amidohydrolase [Chloroflexota bacterium]MBL1194602.1 amidohydrolase [Chloroflexota bacterium]NOH11892.1 amidohydrolase [Chloroflexota bacterium]